MSLAHVTDPETIQEESFKKPNYFLETVFRIFRSPSAKLGGFILGIIIILAVLAPLIAPYGPFAMDYRSIHATPSAKHLMGTDAVGRDIFSRILYGAKYTLFIGLVSEVMTQALGIILGSLAGYFGKRVEMVIMRFSDIWSSIPGVILSILFSSILGPGFINTVIALSVGGVPATIRMVRAQILVERSKEYLEAAESINCSKLSIMFSHLFPNVFSPVLVSFSMGIGRKISAAAGLSYLGLGIQPPLPEWGAILSDGASVLLMYPHVIFYPGVLIGVLILSINLIGDGLRDALDPKLRH